MKDTKMKKITGPEQKRPKNVQNALHKNQLKKSLVKYITSAWDEEKYVVVLRNKELRNSCEYVCFHYSVDKSKTTKTEDMQSWCNYKEADIKMFFSWRTSDSSKRCSGQYARH